MTKKRIARSVRGKGPPLEREAFFQTFIARNLDERQARKAWEALSQAQTDIEFFRRAYKIMQRIEKADCRKTTNGVE